MSHTLVIVTAIEVEDFEDDAALATKIGDAAADALGERADGAYQGYETTERKPELAVKRATAAVAH